MRVEVIPAPEEVVTIQTLEDGLPGPQGPPGPPGPAGLPGPVAEAPLDGLAYLRQSGDWVPGSAGGGEGGAPPSNTNPVADGIAAPGILLSYARGDHRHPYDPTRQPLDATLTALATLDGLGAGLIEQASPDVFTVRKIGVAAATDVPTRAHNDGRYATVAHTQAASTITDFSEAVDDRVAALLVAGANVTLSYSDTSGTLTINSTGGSGGGGTPSDAAPIMDGIAFPGVAVAYSRGDHTHPSDASRVAKTGDSMTGALQLPGGSSTSTSLHFGTLGTGLHGDPIDGSTIAFAVQGITRGYFTTTALTVGVPVVLPANPTEVLHAASKQYVDLRELAANKGVANGYASLDATAKVPAAQLPSFVDDVQEYANFAAFPATGTVSVIYIALDTNKTYRWSGTVYTEISPSPGSTDSVPEGSINLYHTVERASAAAPVQSVSGKTGAVTLTKIDVGLGAVDNTSDAAKPISTATQTALDGKAATSHTQTASTITDFQEAVDDRVAALLVPGANITLNYSDTAGTLTIASTGGGGGGGAATYIGDTPPADPVAGQFFWESDSGNLFIFYPDGTSSQWVSAMVPAPGPQGPQGVPGQWTQLTQAAYDALSPPDPAVLYVVIG